MPAAHFHSSLILMNCLALFQFFHKEHMRLEPLGKTGWGENKSVRIPMSFQLGWPIKVRSSVFPKINLAQEDSLLLQALISHFAASLSANPTISKIPKPPESLGLMQVSHLILGIPLLLGSPVQRKFLQILSTLAKLFFLFLCNVRHSDVIFCSVVLNVCTKLSCIILKDSFL
ncbi:hypothetical protein KP509_1Z050100 [Ceratopteris richardii]|nr:hypothetical protein KP509_1Z050100 [Ceratopteris richardii]